MTRPTGRRVRPIHAYSLLLGLATALPPIIAPLAARAQVSDVVTPAQQAAALAGAKGAVTRLAQMKSFRDIPDVLTEKSAGELGLVMTMMAAMLVGFSALGDDAKAPGAKTPSRQQTDYNAFIARYGLNDPQAAVQAHDLPPAVARDGRQFLLDALTLLDKMGDEKGHSVEASSLADKLHNPDDVTYRVISPTVVRLTLKPQPGQPAEPSMQAVQEADGQWRIDLGDLRARMSGGASAPPPLSPQEQSFLDAAQHGDLQRVKKMLAHRPKLLQAHDPFGKTALFDAVFGDSIPVAKALLAAGADVNAKDFVGKTPLDDALFFHKDDPALLALLRRHGGHTGSKQY